MPNNRASASYVRHRVIDLQERKESTIVVVDFNTPLSEMGRLRKKISKGIVETQYHQQ